MKDRRTTFLEELKRRKVVRVFIAYVIVAWIVLQVADVMFPAMGLPDWTITLTLGLLVALFPVALILTWMFDVTPGGIELTSSADAADAKADKPEATGVTVDDKSLDLLENSITSRSWIENDPDLESIRSHPPYREIIEALPD